MTGRMLSEKLGQVALLADDVGFNTTFFVQHILGLWGMPRRVYTYPNLPHWALLNQISSAGVVILTAGMAAFFFNILHSARRGAQAGPNPWDAWTLEWAADSPPPITTSTGCRPCAAGVLCGTSSSRGSRLGGGTVMPDTIPATRGWRQISKSQMVVGFFLASEFVFFAFLIIAYIDFHSAAAAAGPGLPAASTRRPWGSGRCSCSPAARRFPGPARRFVRRAGGAFDYGSA